MSAALGSPIALCATRVRLRPFLRAVLAAGGFLGGAGAAPPGFAAPDPIAVHCRVFHDLDLDGVLDEGEPPLADIRVTNGDTIERTDAAGTVDLVVDREMYRFATITIPAGWWPTASWFRHVPVGFAGPDTANFGLRPRPETASDPIRWIHIADTQTFDLNDPFRLDVDLEQINQLPLPPLMIINTGDLVEVGSDTTHWNSYITQIEASDFPVFPVVGNHDTTATATPLNNYERYVGPPYYSFEMGSWHFLVYNNEAAPLGTPNQDVWLDRDVAEAAPGSRFLLFQHRMVKEVPLSTSTHWANLGIEAVFSGHWHSTQLTRQPSGIVDYNICRTRSGPLDHTPRSYAIVTCSEDGTIDYKLKRFAVDHRAEVMHPAPNEVIFGSTLDVQVQAYDTSAEVSGISATFDGPAGPHGPFVLAPEGPFQWRAAVDIASWPSGSYTLHAVGSYEDGSPFSKTVVFNRSMFEAPDPAIGGDWPMIRREPKGTSFTSASLEPPLTLAWSRLVPGMVELSSPVVAGGRVFLGTRAENRVEEAGVSAFDAESGAPLWFTHLPGGVALAPAVANGVVVVTSMADSVFGLDASTGSRLWSLRKPSSRYDVSAPIAEGGKAWVGAEPLTYQVNSATGSKDWTSGNIGNDWFPYIYSAPALGTTNLYYSTYGTAADLYGGFRVVSRADGTVSLRVPGAFRSPIWADSLVYVVGDPDRNNQKLTARTPAGSVLWTAPKSLAGGTGPPALGHGVIVVAGAQGGIEAFRASDGASLWTKPVGLALLDCSNGTRGGRATEAAPAIADSTVYIGSADGKLYALGLGDGALKWMWDFKIPIASSAAISGNMLFVGASDNHLYAFTNAAPGIVTGVGVGGPAPLGLRLDPPRPNPARGATRFTFTLARAERVRLDVFDVRGRRVTTLLDGRFEQGTHAIEWDGTERAGRRAAAGVYFARLEAAGSTIVRPLVRLRA